MLLTTARARAQAVDAPADEPPPQLPAPPLEPAPPPATEPAAPPPPPASAAAPAADAPAPPPARVATAAGLASPRAFLDYSDGTFFLRSADDNLLLATGGRVHLDTYAFAGPGVSRYHRGNGSGLAANMFFRRFVLEMGGLVRQHWFFWVGGNFAPTQVDANQAPVSTAAVYDGFIGYQFHPQLQIYAGQYNAPFTMENVTSSRWLDFMERALVVRTLGAPYNKDLGIMLWGSTTEHGAAPFEYQVGVFGGDGMNRPNVDNRFDGMARMVVRPLAGTKGATHRFHLGVSGRLGSRDADYVRYDAPALSTPGGYAFWSPSYTTADKTEVHVLPSGAAGALAGEIYLPFERVDLRGEVVYVHENRREATAADRAATLRKGTLEGIGGYAQVSVWPLGRPRVNGQPAGRYFGLRSPRDRGAEHPYGLQLLLRGEMMSLSYDGNARSAEVADGAISARTTDIRVNALQAAANFWATKHIRLTAEYSLYMFPGSPLASGDAATNQAAAPGANAKPAQASADHLHEISFRVGLAL